MDEQKEMRSTIIKRKAMDLLEERLGNGPMEWTDEVCGPMAWTAYNRMTCNGMDQWHGLS